MFTLETTATAAYVVAAILFILALAGLSKHGASRPVTLSASPEWPSR